MQYLTVYSRIHTYLHWHVAEKIYDIYAVINTTGEKKNTEDVNDIYKYIIYI
jgi:hypothetical protein